jgi:hypothetical protein
LTCAGPLRQAARIKTAKGDAWYNYRPRRHGLIHMQRAMPAHRQDTARAVAITIISARRASYNRRRRHP